MEDKFSKQEKPTEEGVIEDGLSELLSKMAAQRSALQKPVLSSDAKAPPKLEKSQPAAQYIDSQDVCETFADCINAVHFDGQVLRIEFGVTRVKPSDASNPSASQVLQRFPACRLVLTPGAVVGLNDVMQKIASGTGKPPATVPPVKQQK
jgi:hypothetical protein